MARDIYIHHIQVYGSNQNSEGLGIYVFTIHGLRTMVFNNEDFLGIWQHLGLTLPLSLDEQMLEKRRLWSTCIKIKACTSHFGASHWEEMHHSHMSDQLMWDLHLIHKQWNLCWNFTDNAVGGKMYILVQFVISLAFKSMTKNSSKQNNLILQCQHCNDQLGCKMLAFINWIWIYSCFQKDDKEIMCSMVVTIHSAPSSWWACISNKPKMKRTERSEQCLVSYHMPPRPTSVCEYQTQKE